LIDELIPRLAAMIDEIFAGSEIAGIHFYNSIVAIEKYGGKAVSY
jgi:hypothetical protein